MWWLLGLRRTWWWRPVSIGSLPLVEEWSGVESRNPLQGESQTNAPCQNLIVFPLINQWMRQRQRRPFNNIFAFMKSEEEDLRKGKATLPISCTFSGKLTEIAITNGPGLRLRGFPDSWRSSFNYLYPWGSACHIARLNYSCSTISLRRSQTSTWENSSSTQRMQSSSSCLPPFWRGCPALRKQVLSSRISLAEWNGISLRLTWTTSRLS